jgi:Na+-transporting methylmalonyl-CoA/oxaloacetate decarboxylase gamma subunit
MTLFLFRIILFLIFLLIAAKLFGAVIKVLRELFFPQPSHSDKKGTYVHTTPQPPVQKYDNVQDADFKDVDDTK